MVFKRLRFWLIALGVIVVLAMVGANLARQRGDAKAVETELAARRSVETWVRAPGAVKPLVSVNISSNVMGRVNKLYVREGDAVRKGDLLVTLDDTRYRSAVAQAEAMLQAAQAQLGLQQAQAERAQQVLARRRDLAQRGLLSSEALEQADVEARVAAAQVEAGTKEIERLRAARAEAQRDLEETRFVAPIDGVVTALNLEEGENVVIGTMNAPGTVILTVGDRAGMEVEARVSESDVVQVHPGQRVRVEADAAPDSVLEGEVTTVGESGDRVSRDESSEFEVDARILHPPVWLRTGMSADVEILTAHADSALCVPIQALVARTEETVREWNEAAASGRKPMTVGDARPRSRTDENASDTKEPRRQKLVEGVFVVRDGKARFLPVTTGVRGESWIALEGGLEPGGEVVAGPYRVLRHLTDGERVKAKPRPQAQREP
jgi:HlyD family secretion protein